MAFLRAHQFSIMMFMSGICGILAFMTMISSSVSDRKRSILVLMDISAMALLLFDRLSYFYRGDMSSLAYVMVRFSNGLVFFLAVFIPHLVTQYLKELFRDDGGLHYVSRRLKICDGLFAAGTLLIIVSQFTGLFYTFDESNIYHRSAWYGLSYVVPILMVLLQEWTILRYRDRLNRGVVISLALGLILPTVMSLVQLVDYGVSLTNLTMVFVVIIFYVYTINDMRKAVETARSNELEFYKLAKRKETALFEQTAEALANAIDAKDRYTHGHSTRVATLSRRIAREAGFSEEECAQVYFAGLLHDIGKIGVKDDIINKSGKLTPEEFQEIKRHPILGDQILSSIKQSPSLSVGALSP